MMQAEIALTETISRSEYLALSDETLAKLNDAQYGAVGGASPATQPGEHGAPGAGKRQSVRTARVAWCRVCDFPAARCLCS